ncbi:MAG: YicC/YloC family endoribonuclease [Candidatus Theseobacter exili]|nr:YicC/YloC family endoribonuclease [Candidatus Theseobacter exili]
MIVSMTGYGRGDGEGDTGRFVVEIQTLNRKYQDIQVQMGRKFLFLENIIRKMVSENIRRGRVTVSIHFEEYIAENLEPVIDVDLARKYCDVLTRLCEELDMSEEITLRDILDMEPSVLRVHRSLPEEIVELPESLRDALAKALDSLQYMRSEEGEYIRQEIIKYIEILKVCVEQIASLIPASARRYEEKLRNRIDDLLLEEAGEDRILREVAIMAERCDITEEVVRMKSHLQQFDELIYQESAGPVGRTMDFLVQEMLREANTIGSKSSEKDISRLVLQMKNELDRIKEQIQNIE